MHVLSKSFYKLNYLPAWDEFEWLLQAEQVGEDQNNSESSSIPINQKRE